MTDDSEAIGETNIDKGKPKYTENEPQCNFVHHKSRMT
jgi:hypothetical protein